MNAPEILFLSKQHVFSISEAKQAQKGVILSLGNLLYGILAAATGRGDGRKLEMWIGGAGTDDTVSSTEGGVEKYKHGTQNMENGEQTDT